MPKVVIDRRGPVSVLILNRPDVHNCVDGETAEALTEAIEGFGADDDARVLVVTGAGEKSFCSGADLKSERSLLSHRYVDRSGPMGFARLDTGKPTIAAVNGYCFAGGMELACWCDFRIAATNAEFGALNRRWGVPFTDGGTQRFARIAGLGNALWLIATGIRIDAQRALGIGLVQEVVPDALARALELAERIAAYPNQAGLRGDRAAMIGTYGVSLPQGLRLEEELSLSQVSDPEMIEGLRQFASGNRPEAPRPA